MRAIVTGQVGVDKGPHLEAVKAQARARGIDLEVCHVGQMMYAEAPDVPPGRILNIPIGRLNTLRRSVFKEILRTAEQHEHVLVNTHATFRWKHGLFAAFDFDQMKALKADAYMTIVDSVEDVHQRLLQDHDIDHTLKDIMIWREEEVLATEVLANAIKGSGNFFMLSRGRDVPTTETIYRLVLERWRKKAYLSFPMTQIMDLPGALTEITAFKRAMQEHFICFDPADVDEFRLHMDAVKALQEGRTTMEVSAAAGPLTLKTSDVAQISGDILGQSCARDLKMVDQSDMIVSLIPQLPSGQPAISSGVERELRHAFEGGKEVYVVWRGAGTPSAFITETATKVFAELTEAIDYFRAKGYLQER